jgi:succinate dehydrogenase/fumarate reductase flavoprotein subunit
MIIYVLIAAGLAALMAAASLIAALRPTRPPEALLARLDRLEAILARGLDSVPAALREEVRALREELRGVLADQSRTSEARFASFAAQVKTSTDSFARLRACPKPISR